MLVGFYNHVNIQSAGFVPTSHRFKKDHDFVFVRAKNGEFD